MWRIAGGDCDLLERSGKNSQFSFTLIGALYLVINCVILAGFFGMFYGVFDSPIIAVVGTLIMGFLVSNIYRLTLFSLEPQTLPVEASPGSRISANVLRYISVFLFAFFVGKNFEMLFVNLLESYNLMNYDGSSGYLIHMQEADLNYPMLWLITALVVFLFILPIYLRQRLAGRTKEYYSLKSKRDIRIVKEQYIRAKTYKIGLMKMIYAQYENYGEHKVYNEPEPKYADAPFNTKPVAVQPSLKSSEDFIELEDWI